MEAWKADIRRFLREDVGHGDVTSEAVLGGERVRAVIRAKDACVVAGLEEAEEAFRQLRCRARSLVREGRRVRQGTKVMAVTGPAKRVLAGERLALNFLMRMSGIATATREVVDRAHRVNPRVRITHTRKTVPGFRYFDMQAVILGGGRFHRGGLDSGVLVKDNHLSIVDLEKAVRRAKRTLLPVEVEAQSLREARRAAAAGADTVMLDNFTPAQARAAYRELKTRWPHLHIEVSGGITAKNVARYSRWADTISLGSLTHSARAANFSLDIVRVEKRR